MQRNYLARWLTIIGMLGVLAGCSDSPEANPSAVRASEPVAEARLEASVGKAVKELSSQIIDVSVNKIMVGADGKPVTRPLFYAEATLKKNFTWGSAQDWNSLASTVDAIAKRAFERDDIARLRFKVVSDQGEDWAYVDLKRYQLPANWKDVSYLEHFAVADVSSPNPEASTALCQFYEKYESARPKDTPHCTKS